MPQQESIGSIDSQVSAIFIEALYGPTIDNSIIPNLDKMVHVLVFGLLAFLLLRYLRSIGFANGWRILLGVGLIITVMGVLADVAGGKVCSKIYCQR